jgi:hypothetical protein
MGKDFKELLKEWRVPDPSPGVDARVAETFSRSRRRGWSRWTGSVRLPAPILAFLLVLQVVSGAVIMRNFLSPPSQVTLVPERVVEVPVVKEKVVTHVVYLPAPASDTLGRRARYSMADTESGKPPMDLSGFRPVSEFRIQVIKGEERNER